MNVLGTYGALARFVKELAGGRISAEQIKELVAMTADKGRRDEFPIGEKTQSEDVVEEPPKVPGKPTAPSAEAMIRWVKTNYNNGNFTMAQMVASLLKLPLEEIHALFIVKRETGTSRKPGGSALYVLSYRRWKGAIEAIETERWQVQEVNPKRNNSTWAIYRAVPPLTFVGESA